MPSYLALHWKPLVAAGAGVVVVAALVVGLSAGAGRQAAPGAGPPLAPSGPVFPPLAGADTLSGSPAGTAAFHGRRYVVNLWASWCEGCRAEAADIARFTRDHPEMGFLGVDVSDETGPARRFAARYGWRHRSIGDPSGAIAGRLGVPGLPATFFVDATGHTRGEVLGPVGYGALVDATARLSPR